MRQVKSNEERFWAKTERQANGCLLWTGALVDGYGWFSWPEEGRKHWRGRGAHRFMLALAGVEVPPGHDPDHLCRNRHCVELSHIEIVPHSVNVRRGLLGQTSANRQRAKTHCPKGHPYSGENLYRRKSGGRVCRACARLHKGVKNPRRVVLYE